MTYRIYASLAITNLNCNRPLHYNEIKYQGKAIPILCDMNAHGLQLELEFSNYLALQISNAALPTLDSNYPGPALIAIHYNHGNKFRRPFKESIEFYHSLKPVVKILSSYAHLP